MDSPAGAACELADEQVAPQSPPSPITLRTVRTRSDSDSSRPKSPSLSSTGSGSGGAGSRKSISRLRVNIDSGASAPGGPPILSLDNLPTRFPAAKAKLNDLLFQWLATPGTQDFIRATLADPHLGSAPAAGVPSGDDDDQRSAASSNTDRSGSAGGSGQAQAHAQASRSPRIMGHSMLAAAAAATSAVASSAGVAGRSAAFPSPEPEMVGSPLSPGRAVPSSKKGIAVARSPHDRKATRSPRSSQSTSPRSLSPRSAGGPGTPSSPTMNPDRFDVLASSPREGVFPTGSLSPAAPGTLAPSAPVPLGRRRASTNSLLASPSPVRSHRGPASSVADPAMEEIPTFYIPGEGGRGRGRRIPDDALSKRMVEIDALFAENPRGLALSDFPAVAKELCSLPSFFGAPLFRRIKVLLERWGFVEDEPAAEARSEADEFDSEAKNTEAGPEGSGDDDDEEDEEEGRISKAAFCLWWKREVEPFDACDRFFRLAKQPDANFIVGSDF